MTITDVQLAGLLQGTELDAQIVGAAAMVAEAVRQEDPETTDNYSLRQKWAASVLKNPNALASQLRGVVYTRYADICEPAGLTVTDQQVRTAIADAVTTLATG